MGCHGDVRQRLQTPEAILRDFMDNGVMSPERRDAIRLVLARVHELETAIDLVKALTMAALAQCEAIKDEVLDDEAGEFVMSKVARIREALTGGREK